MKTKTGFVHKQELPPLHLTQRGVPVIQRQGDDCGQALHAPVFRYLDERLEQDMAQWKIHCVVMTSLNSESRAVMHTFCPCMIDPDGCRPSRACLETRYYAVLDVKMSSKVIPPLVSQWPHVWNFLIYGAQLSLNVFGMTETKTSFKLVLITEVSWVTNPAKNPYKSFASNQVTQIQNNLMCEIYYDHYIMCEIMHSNTSRYHA